MMTILGTSTVSPATTTSLPDRPITDKQCEIKLVLADFLEDLAADEDALNSHRSPRSQGTEVLFRKIWRKFQNPVAKINRRLGNLEQLILQANDFCNQSHMASNKVLSSLVRGECSQVNLELRHFTIRTDEQLAQLEKKIGRQMLKMGKMLDRASRDGALTTHPYPASCDQVMEKGYAASGIYTIQPTYDDTFEAFCDLQTDGGGWTVIQRRGNFGSHRENFIRDWEGYRLGFGDARKEFWIGNDRLNEFTTRDDVVLRVQLEDWDGNHTYAEYSTFRVGDEDEKYILHIGNYSGNASDSFGGHNGKLFSTFDAINDESPSCCPCARTYDGGWWFYNCFEAHLNGPYLANPVANDYFRGIIWEHWRGDYSLYSSEMKIRPRSLHYKYTGRGGSPLDS
uniref:Fibrinogen C-terminal domain-containing protein n=1 Tax=Strigamia maritima TaxID=126957 RepID=T1J0N5_STRMM